MSQFSQKEILEIVNQILKQNVNTETSLYEVFEDSIQMFRFLGEVKNKLSIEFGMLDLVKAETIGDLVDKIQEKLGKGAEVEKKNPPNANAAVLQTRERAKLSRVCKLHACLF